MGEEEGEGAGLCSRSSERTLMPPGSANSLHRSQPSCRLIRGVRNTGPTKGALENRQRPCLPVVRAPQNPRHLYSAPQPDGRGRRPTQLGADLAGPASVFSSSFASPTVALWAPGFLGHACEAPGYRLPSASVTRAPQEAPQSTGHPGSGAEPVTCVTPFQPFRAGVTFHPVCMCHLSWGHRQK